MNKKNSLILTFLLCYSTVLFSQEIKATYRFDIPVNNKKESIQYKEGHKVKIVDTTKKDSVSFVYLKFNGNDSISKKLNKEFYYEKNNLVYNDSTLENFKKEDFSLLLYIPDENKVTNVYSDTLNLRIHSIDKKTFNNSTSRYYYYHRFKGVKAGLFTVPFKLRLDDFDFEQNVNLGMSLSFRFRLNRKVDNDWLISPTLGIGLSTIKLNPKNSDLIEGEDSNRSASAFSLSGGLLIELKETINLSFQYGFDFLGNDDKDVNWKYNRQPWLGIGINIGFPISKNNDENENDENQTP